MYQPENCGIQFMMGDRTQNKTWGCNDENDQIPDSLVSQAIANVTFTKFHNEFVEWAGCLGILPSKYNALVHQGVLSSAEKSNP